MMSMAVSWWPCHMRHYDQRRWKGRNRNEVMMLKSHDVHGTLWAGGISDLEHRPANPGCGKHSNKFMAMPSVQQLDRLKAWEATTYVTSPTFVRYVICTLPQAPRAL